MAADINLINIANPNFKTSQYVLTSPRSLQACANLKIKPVDLLPQTLEEFRASQVGKCLQREALKGVHEQMERERRVKLWKARKERQKLIQAEPTHENRKLTSSSRRVTSSDIPNTIIRPTVQSAQWGHIPMKDKKILTALSRKRDLQNELENELDLSSDNISYRLDKVATTKQILDDMKLFKIKSNNIAQQQRFKANLTTIEKNKRLEEAHMRKNLEIKHSEADSRLMLQASLREEEQQATIYKRRLRETQRKYTADNLAADLNKWQGYVEKLSELNMARAVEISKQALLEKRYAIQQKREERKYNQNENMKKLQRELNERQEFNNKLLAEKYERMECFVKQRNNKMLQSQQTAHRTAELRDSIKNGYLINSFDQVARYPEERSILETTNRKRHSDPLRHYSKVFL